MGVQDLAIRTAGDRLQVISKSPRNSNGGEAAENFFLKPTLNKPHIHGDFTLEKGKFRARSEGFPPSAEQFPPPVGISKRAIKLWFGILENWQPQDASGLVLLENLCRCQMRIDEAQRLLDSEGQVVRNRFGRPEQHPDGVILWAESANFVRLHKQLQSARKRENHAVLMPWPTAQDEKFEYNPF